MKTTALMKDQLGQEAVFTLSQSLSAVIDDFPQQQFITAALAGLDSLELKQRVQHIIAVLADYLPDDFSQSSSVLLAVKQVWNDSEQTESWGSFTAWPLIDYVAVYGLDQPELALKSLKALTPLFTAEFAVRPFIEQHFELTYQHLLRWSEDDDEHVRRLSSEGIRPRLPWGKQLTQFRNDPESIFPVLERLKDDSSLYVRKSVANNLNDIAKDHPEKVIQLCQQWLEGATPERQWIIRHALRGLVKSGHPAVFPLLGYAENPKVNIIAFDLTENSIKLGQKVDLFLSLLSHATTSQRLVVDYKMHHVKANGSLSSKVFKWKNITLEPQQSLQLTKFHPFKKITTRQYYSGIHTIELLINGVSYAKAEFELLIL